MLGKSLFDMGVSLRGGKVVFFIPLPVCLVNIYVPRVIVWCLSDSIYRGGCATSKEQGMVIFSSPSGLPYG
jgi:hypothetical protein